MLNKFPTKPVSAPHPISATTQSSGALDGINSLSDFVPFLKYTGDELVWALREFEIDAFLWRNSVLRQAAASQPA